MLNPEGESLGDLGRGNAVPVQKWADSSFFAFAINRAEESMLKAGALLPINFDQTEIICMEYHRQHKLAFVFHRRIAGKDVYHPCVIDLSDEVIKELRATNRWPNLN